MRPYSCIHACVQAYVFVCALMTHVCEFQAAHAFMCLMRCSWCWLLSSRAHEFHATHGLMMYECD